MARKLNRNYLTIVESKLFKDKNIRLLYDGDKYWRAFLYEDNETDELNGIKRIPCEKCGK